MQVFWDVSFLKVASPKTVYECSFAPDILMPLPFKLRIFVQKDNIWWELEIIKFVIM